MTEFTNDPNHSYLFKKFKYLLKKDRKKVESFNLWISPIIKVRCRSCGSTHTLLIEENATQILGILDGRIFYTFYPIE